MVMSFMVDVVCYDFMISPPFTLDTDLTSSPHWYTIILERTLLIASLTAISPFFLTNPLFVGVPFLLSKTFFYRHGIQSWIMRCKGNSPVWLLGKVCLLEKEKQNERCYLSSTRNSWMKVLFKNFARFFWIY